MPNWAQGSMRVRGEYEQVKKFIKEGIEYNARYNLHYIKGTTRGFIQYEHCSMEDYLIMIEEDENIEEAVTIPFDVKFAWDCNARQIQLISIKYNVDIRLTLFEKLNQFSREVSVISGEIMEDNTITYGDYKWDCPFPLLGG